MLIMKEKSLLSAGLTVGIYGRTVWSPCVAVSPTLRWNDTMAIPPTNHLGAYDRSGRLSFCSVYTTSA